MNANNSLDMIGDAKGIYVWDAQKVRSGSLPVTQKKQSIKRELLIAAVISLMLLLVGCAIGYVQGWFVDFFDNKSEAPLSDSQIALIEDNEQQINEAQSQNGWTVALRSALKDSNKAYIIIGITAPEGVDLEPEVVDGVMIEQFTPGNVWPASMSEQYSEIVTYPAGVMPSSMQTSWQEDGDGKDNTRNYVLTIEPDEPNLVRIFETMNGTEIEHYFYIKKDGLYPDVGIKYDPDGARSKWFRSASIASEPYDASKEVWEPITEENYQRIVDDYQVMQYRLIPVS